MRVSIDEAACQGHGRCYALAPDLFEPDELGNGEVLPIGNNLPEHLIDGARRAVDNCPEHAITITEETGNG